MVRWHLQVLGVPLLSPQTLNKKAEVRFRYRDTWLLLASLALDPSTTRREALILRLELDGNQKGKDRLRLRLNDLRHGAPHRGKSDQSYCGLGADIILADVATVTLSPHTVQTDLQVVQAALVQAARLPTPQQKIACLRGASALLRGSFMEGYDLPGPSDGWLESLRVEADRLSAEVWLQLAQALEAAGERRSAFDAARKAYALRPENPETLELLLDLADGAREQEEILQLARKLKIEALLPHLEVLEREGVPPTISEENVLQAAVQTRLSQLSQKSVEALKRIACFPQDFTADQALAIADVSAETLERLVKAFPLHKGEDRYYLLPALRSALRSLLSQSERDRFSQRHAQAFLQLSLQEPPDHDTFRQKLQREAGHLVSAIQWFQSQTPTLEGVHLINQCRHWLGKFAPLRQALLQAVGYLEAATETVGLPLGESQRSAQILGLLAMDQQEFKKALHWFQRFDIPCHHHWYYILMAAHHGADDAVFDHYANRILSGQFDPRMLPLAPESKKRFIESVHLQVADNSSARGKYAEALEHNEQAFSLRREVGQGEDSAPALWSQRAAILSCLGRAEESARSWDRALSGYEAQGNLGGVAECYQAIGKRLASQGQGGLSISLLRQAIDLFRSVGNGGAVAATQGDLGDIWLNLGEHLKARELYEQGLDYWQAQKNPRWIAKFEERLQQCEASSGKMPP